MKAFKRHPWCLFVLLLACSAAFGQFSSSIEGNVTDVSGAIIPSAKVVLTNTDTGVVQITQSNDAGVYRFPALGPGHYKVTASAPGFATFTQENINLTAMRVQAVDVKLPIESTQSTVTVTETPSAVETDEAKIQTVTSELEIQELPIQSRNVYGVANQTPGVTGTGFMGGQTDIFNATNTPAIVANGAPNHSNTYLLDGVSLDDSPSGGDAKLTPNPDSVGEVVVSTTDYSAEFGKAGSLVTQITSKSGTNQFHGSGFEQFKNNNLTARTEFQNYKDPLNGYITPFTNNEFGGSFGGPIRKDSTFVFGSLDMVRASTTSSNVVTVEDPSFVSWMTANLPNNLSTSILNKYKATVSPTPRSVAAVAQVEQSQGGGRHSDAAHDCADTVNDPNGIGPLGMPCSMAMIDTTVGTTSAIHNGYQYNARVDQSFHESRDRIYANFYHTELTTPWNLGVRKQFLYDFPQWSWFGAVNYSHVFSPSILNQAAAGYTRTSLVIGCNFCDLLPTNINGVVGFGDGFSPVGFAQNDFHWRDMISIVHGKHALKTGFEMFHNQDYAPFTVNDNRQQAWGFNTIFDFASEDVSNYGAVAFNPSTGGIANGNHYFVNSTYGAYVQDDWKISKDLTLNLGVRWDATNNPKEARGNLSTLTMGTGNTLQDRVAGISVGLNPDPSKRRPFIDHKMTYFAPRFGFAWRPFGAKDWSVRGGAGIFFDRGGNTNWTDTEAGNPTPDFYTFTADVNNPSSPQPPAFGLCKSAKFPYGCPLPGDLASTVPVKNARGGYGMNSTGIGGPDPHLKMAYLENFFVGVQRAFKSDWLAEVNFVHSNAIHEYSIFNVNRRDGADTITKVGNSYQNSIAPGWNPYFSSINYTSNQAGSSYNGMTAYLRRSFKAGYSFQVSFTGEKTLDVTSVAPGAQKGQENAVVIDAYNVKAQRSVSGQDIPKQLSFNGLWQIPVPHIGNSVLKTVASGWQISGLGTLMAGLPATVFSTRSQDDFNLDGFFYDLPDVPTFGRTKKGLKRSDYLKGTFKASDFPLPVDASGIPTGQEGNLGRNTFRGPGFAETSLALAKDTELPFFFKESSRLQFRIDMYNAFNRVNLQGWDTNLADATGNFGRAGGTAQARTIQLSTKLTF